MNQILEEMAQAIFKSWFIDFDGVPEEDLVESELGLIPRGWEVKPAQKIAQINIGKTPPRKEPQWFSKDHNDIRWVSIKDLANQSIYINKSSECLTPEAITKHRVKIIPNNTVILSFKLTVGRVSITVGEMCSNEAIAHFCLSESSEISTEFLYLYLKQFNYESLGSTSSIATAVNSKIIKSMPVLVPPSQIVNKFNSVVLSIFNISKSIQFQSQILSELRDTLLPKLISGELRIPEAEKMVEDVL
jgi:type I restriction enzyme, S subunit